MPNHVTNILIAHGDEGKVRAMFEAIKNDEIGVGSIDFNKVIPTPENIYQGSLGKKEFAKYGKNNWLDWNTANWGSKWNSYGYNEYTPQDFEGNRIEFLTAWSNVDKVIGQLAEKYPDLSFEYTWADEDFGYNTGKKEFENSKEVFSHIPPGGSTEALELAAEVHGVNLADEGYLYNEETGEYEYYEQEPQSLQME